MKLSENFTKEEFEFSDKAVKKNIENKMTEDLERNAIALCFNVLQPLRDEFGTIVISSGYRCLELNKAVGGEKNSQHMKAEAADIIAKEANLMNVFKYIVKELDFDQCFLETNKNGRQWIHVSYSRNGNRRHYGRLNP